MVDDFTRECLAAVADTSISGARVARALDALSAGRARPSIIVSDNGPELTTRALLAWTNRAGLDWHDIAPGKPQQKRLRRELHRPAADELLNEEICERLAHARRVRARWRLDYHQVRPHSAPAGRPPRQARLLAPRSTPCDQPQGLPS